MNKRVHRSRVITLALIAVAALAQEPAAEVKGELESAQPFLGHTYTVRLQDVRTRYEVGRAEVESDGQFAIRSISSGDYVLQLLNRQEEVLQEETVTIGQRPAYLKLRLVQKEDPAPPGGTVSLKQLQHPPSRKAVQELAAAQKLSEAGDYQGAAGELEKAVHDAPEFAEAHTNLAAQYIRLGHYEDGMREIARSTGIAGPNVRDLCNRAFAELALGRRTDAVQSVQAALRIAPESPNAHYIFGMALAADVRTLREAEAHLAKAAETISSARLSLEKVRTAIRNAHVGL